MYRFPCHGYYCFLDLSNRPTLVLEDASVSFLLDCPNDHIGDEGPAEIHLFVFATVFLPGVYSCRNTSSDLIRLTKNAYCPVSSFCCVGTFIQEMVRCFLLLFT